MPYHHRVESPIDTGVSITARQFQVLLAHGRGLGAKEIARELGLSIHTVRQHLRELRGALGARNAHHLTSRAAELGFFDRGAQAR